MHVYVNFHLCNTLLADRQKRFGLFSYPVDCVYVSVTVAKRLDGPSSFLV